MLRKAPESRVMISKRIILPALIIIFGSLFVSMAMIRTGSAYDLGVGYWGPLARDGVWHEALVAQIARGIPPINPGFAGLQLTNYHYFYDAFIILLSKATFLPPRTVIYILFPIALSVILGQMVYFFSLSLFKSKLAAIFSLFFLYFGSSFGWILSLLRGVEIGGESSFWANQPVSLNLNPPFAFSLLIIIGILLLLSKYVSANSKKIGFFIILLSGIIVGVKVYAGVIVLAGLFGASVVRYKKSKRWDLFVVFLGSSLVSLLIFFAISPNSVSLLMVQPLWLIDTMIDAGDRVGIPNFTARRFAYLGGHKWVQYAFFEFLAILIFIAGNLGTRLVGVFGTKKKYITSELHAFLIFGMIAAFLPPLIFVQKGNPWNIIQFFYYFLFFAGFYAANGLAIIWEGSRKRRFLKLAVLAILVITPISSVAAFRGWLYPNPPAYLSTKEAEALAFLAEEPDGTVVVHPFDPSLRKEYQDPYPLAVYADSAYVSAFSGKAAYVEDVEQQIILNVNYDKRLADSRSFFDEADLNSSNEFLESENISYVYLPKIYHLPAAEGLYNMKKIFENSEVNIYKVVH